MIYLPQGQPVLFHPSSSNQFRQGWMVGADLEQYTNDCISILRQTVDYPLFRIRKYQIKYWHKIDIFISCDKGLTFHSMEKGILPIKNDRGREIVLTQGAYIFHQPTSATFFGEEGSECIFWEIVLQPGFVKKYNGEREMTLSNPGVLNRQMKETLQRLLWRKYSEPLRKFFYELSLQALLQAHLCGRIISVDSICNDMLQARQSALSTMSELEKYSLVEKAQAIGYHWAQDYLLERF